MQFAELYPDTKDPLTQNYTYHYRVGVVEAAQGGLLNQQRYSEDKLRRQAGI